MKALLVGHFSTIGDIDSLMCVENVLVKEGIPYSIAAYSKDVARSIDKAIWFKHVNPNNYTHLFVICGPYWPGLLRHRGIDIGNFAHCVKIGINITMIEPVSEWNPFDVLIERDSERKARPDITFLRDTPRVPVVGRCLIDSQKEYGNRQAHHKTGSIVDDFFKRSKYSRIEVDTRWPRIKNRVELGSSEEILSLIAKCDVLITNRLHGLVYGLKAAVPVVVIDSILGGDKVSRQARTLEWPMCIPSEELTVDILSEAVQWARTDEAKQCVRQSIEIARTNLANIEDEIQQALEVRRSEKAIRTTPTRYLDNSRSRPAIWRRVALKGVGAAEKILRYVKERI